MRASMHNSVLSYMTRALAVVILVSGIFGVVWLRSSIRSEEYEIGSLERELGGVLKERKYLLAERAQVISIQAMETDAGDGAGMEFPDRKKVFYIKRDRGDIPYEASLRR